MAFIYISEYADLARGHQGQPIASGSEPALAESRVAISGSSVQSAEFNTATRFVMIHADATCSIKFGSDPTAVAATGRMGAGESRFYGVVAGHKVAVITNS